MKYKFSILILSALISSSAFSAVVRSQDKTHNCTLYRVTTEKTPIQAKESVVIDKDVYGLTTENMEVDFDQREVRVNLVANVILGVNRILNSKARITEDNSEFKFLTNQLNRKVLILEKACVDANNALIYAQQFPNE